MRRWRCDWSRRRETLDARLRLPPDLDTLGLAWLLANWCTGNPKCFTCKIKAQYRRTRRELFPVLSRIQNIGYDLGENNRSPEWYRANHRTPWVAGRLTADMFVCQTPSAT